MSSINLLQQAVVNAALEFSIAREKLMRAEYEYNFALNKDSKTYKAVDEKKEFKFTNTNPFLTDV
jgi:hypothetical protein